MAAANLDELPGWAGELLERSRVAHLSYLDDRDRPRVLPVTFAVAGGALWTAIDDKPKRRPGDEIARVRYLRRRPEAALCVDHYEADWTRLAWVQVLGTVEVLEAADAARLAAAAETARLAAAADALDRLAAKYEPYRLHPPRGPFLRLAPARLLCWRAQETK